MPNTEQKKNCHFISACAVQFCTLPCTLGNYLAVTSWEKKNKHNTFTCEFYTNIYIYSTESQLLLGFNGSNNILC